MRCWGWNATGQRGDGTTTDRMVPGPVALPGPAAQVVAGQDHTCARLGDGSLACWGDNSTGGLGTAGPPSSPTPRRVATPAPVAQLALGAGFTCALLAEHTTSCWGNVGADCASPWPVPGAFALVALVPTHCVPCGRDARGMYSCWYVNEPPAAAPGARSACVVSGPAGGDPSDPAAFLNYPEQPITTDATDVAIGRSIACALRPSATVECWSWGAPMTRLDALPTPVAPVPGLPASVRAIAVGWEHACALVADGSVWCWGRGDGGQLGDGAAVDRASAAPVAGLSNVTHIAAGGAHSCAIDGDGVTWCWGANQNGRLGDGTMTNRATPVRVAW